VYSGGNGAAGNGSRRVSRDGVDGGRLRGGTDG